MTGLEAYLAQISPPLTVAIIVLGLVAYQVGWWARGRTEKRIAEERARKAAVTQPPP